MNKSVSTTTMNMQRSQLMRPKLAQSTLTTPKATKSTMRLPQIAQSQVQGKQMEENYVEKLHNHIQILNENIKSMKGKQNDFQGQMLNMMSKDNMSFIDNPIQSQEKFKLMKQKYLQLINELEVQKVSLDAEVISLSKKNEHLEKMLSAEENINEVFTKDANENIRNTQEKASSAKIKSTNILGEVVKLEDQHNQTNDNYTKKLKSRKEKEFKDGQSNQIYEEDLKREEVDYETKRKENEKLKGELKLLEKNQEEDVRYGELMEKNKNLKSQLLGLESERDKVIYELKEIELRVKLGDEDKDFEAQERRRMNDEKTKYSDIYDDIRQRNEKRIEAKLQNSDSVNLRKIKLELHKLEKQIKEAKDEHGSKFKEFEKQTLEMIHKNDYLNETQQQNQITDQNLAKIYAEFNAIKENYDSRMGQISDKEVQLEKLSKDKEHYSDDIKKLEEEHTYLKAKAEFLQEHVNLEEELRKVKIDDLKNTIGTNQQFNQSIADLQGQWEEMRRFAKYRK